MCLVSIYTCCCCCCSGCAATTTTSISISSSGSSSSSVVVGLLLVIVVVVYQSYGYLNFRSIVRMHTDRWVSCAFVCLFRDFIGCFFSIVYSGKKVMRRIKSVCLFVRVLCVSGISRRFPTKYYWQWRRSVLKCGGRDQSDQATKLFQLPRKTSFTFNSCRKSFDLDDVTLAEFSNNSFERKMWHFRGSKHTLTPPTYIQRVKIPNVRI